MSDPLDKLIAEQNFSNSDRADPGSAAKIGKLLGAKVIAAARGEDKLAFCKENGADAVIDALVSRR